MRRNGLCFLVTAALLKSNAAFAGCPCPDTSTVEVTGERTPCQFRFRPDGALDVMTVTGTVRDCFLDLLNSINATISLEPDAGTLALSSCTPLSYTALTDINGVVHFSFSRIAGRGTVDVVLSQENVCGHYELARTSITFTSPDLDANGTVNIIDLGLWAGGLPPGYLQTSDYDCNGTVNIIDLGVWAGGLGLGCGSAPAEARE